MKKIGFCLTLLISLILYTQAVAAFDEWWNVAWNYRMKVDINSSQYTRTDWPVEMEINFTELLNDTFDINSTRVIEYSYSGSILHELPSQFDAGEDFNATSNAVGTVVFLMNGTTPGNSTRLFYIYYDRDAGKPASNYSTSIVYSNSTQTINVNNTFLSIYIDTNRGENTSGLYRVVDKYQNVIVNVAGSVNKTAEYIEYFNGTDNLTFDLIGNFTIRSGPVRLVIEQEGDEVVFGNPALKTNEAKITKKYYIYDRAGPEVKGTFIKISQSIVNNAGYEITRASISGAPAFDLNRTLSSGFLDTYDINSSDPYSWVWGAGSGGETLGVANFNETGIYNYSASIAGGRIGINLSSTVIGTGSSISQSSLVYFGTGGTDATTEFLDIINGFIIPISINQSSPESMYVVINASSDAVIYNRNETILLYANISDRDPYNLTGYINATIDMGTVDGADDQTITLYDDGTHNDTVINDTVFTNIFGIANNATTGIWTVNFTAYTNSSEYLNSTLYTFNITDSLDVTINVINPFVLEGEVIFATVYAKSYRGSWIPGAGINCSYESTEIINITDNDDGSYSINFTAPSVEKTYTLACNATKNGNFGNNTASFTVEPDKTIINIVPYPSLVNISSITIYDNEAFEILVNVSNIENGTAYNSNITIELLAGWGANVSLEQCENISMGSYCERLFNLTVPNNTLPGTYYINLTTEWTNPDGTTDMNETAVTVNVTTNPKLDVLETTVSSEAADGKETVAGSFIVLSIGNYELQDINFNCYAGEVCQNFTVKFIPSSIASIAVSENETVFVNVTVPLLYNAGTYNAYINVSANNTHDTFLLEITIPSKTNITITTLPSDYDAYSVTQDDNETFLMISNFTNVGNSTALFVNVTLTAPFDWVTNSTEEYCGNLTSYDTCTRYFEITISNGTLPGTYPVNISVNWTNLDSSTDISEMQFNVTIVSNAKINISTSNISGVVSGGIESEIGNFTIFSIGNDDLQDINFNCYAGEVCQNFTVKFIPSSIASIAYGENQTIFVNVTVPQTYAAGIYNGTVNISSSNNGYKYLTLYVTVPINRTWNMSDTICQKVESPNEGTACEVTVINLGNVMVNFTITPQTGNHTEVNVTNFTVGKDSNYTFSVLYNVTGYNMTTYISNFTIDAVQADANPDKMNLIVILLPFQAPIINITILPDSIAQTEDVEFFVNVSDRSDSGIEWVGVNVTRPNGLSELTNMTNTSEFGSGIVLSTWYKRYPDTNESFGNTTDRGIYQVKISAKDNIGNVGNLTVNLSVYKKLVITANTLSDTYLQGDTGSIYYIARDINDSGLANISAALYIFDSNNNMSYYATEETNSDGIIYPLPSFTLSSDVPVGNYTLTTNSSYYDDVVNKSITVKTNSSFQVKERTITVSGLFADIETTVVWYPDNTMKFGFLIYNGEGSPVDPDELNLTVYDSADNLYLFADLTTSNPIEREAKGFYSFDHAMGGSTPVGMFLAVLEAVQGEFRTTKLKAFRVSRGGPYDVRIELMENEVRQGEYLDFIVTVENKGEVSQDVYLEYWVSSGATSYYYAAESVYTPALMNQSFTRGAYIYSNQPLGNYTLNVKATYDYVQPPAPANSSFIVIEGLPSPPTTIIPGPGPSVYPPTGGVVTPTEPVSGILISKYNSNVSLAPGMVKIESVVVENIGGVDLRNITLSLLDIPSDWYNVTPGSYELLPDGNSSVFLITFRIPEDAEFGVHKARLIASSSTQSDQKTMEITIYESLKEVLLKEIEKLKEDLQDIIIETRIAERQGKNVSVIYLMIEEIQAEIGSAEENLEKDDLDEALDNVANAKNLIEQTRVLLGLTGVEVFEFPLWLFFIVSTCVAIALSSLYILKRKKSLGRVLELTHMKRFLAPKIDKDSLIKEKNKLSRVLSVLEREKNEKIISIKAYDEIRKGVEAKLAEIEKKLKKA